MFIKASQSNGMSSLNKINKANNNINSSCINALRFDTNSNGSYDELINLSNQSNSHDANSQQQQQQLNAFSKAYNKTLSRSSPMNRLKISENTANRYINRNISGVQTPKNGENIESEENVNNNSSSNSSNNNQSNNEIDPNLQQQHNRTRITPTIIRTESGSPPPPPPISAAPSPTKLPQFYPYSATNNNSHIMHRPIPILQKADAALSSLINNLTSSSPLSQATINNSDLKLSANNNSNNLNNKNSSSNNETSVCDNQTGCNDSSQMNKTPTCDLNELLKINNQQQLISTLRSNSLSNNSPLMFNNPFGMNFNSNNNNLISPYTSNSGANVIFFFIEVLKLIYF